MKTVIRFTGSPDSNPAQWLRINELTTQPGPGSAYRVTIEPMASVQEVPVWELSDTRWVAGVTREAWNAERVSSSHMRFQNGTAAMGSTREEALANLAKAKARGPL